MLGKIFGNFGFWDICQNVLDQSDCRIIKSTISPEQNDEKRHVDKNSFKLKADWKILG